MAQTASKKIASMSRESLEMIAQRFRVLGEVSRLEILQALCQRSHSVQELCDVTGMGQANVSKHLALLLENGIVAKRKEGLFTYYSIADESIYQLCGIVCGALSKRLAQAQKAFK